MIMKPDGTYIPGCSLEIADKGYDDINGRGPTFLAVFVRYSRPHDHGTNLIVVRTENRAEITVWASNVLACGFVQCDAPEWFERAQNELSPETGPDMPDPWDSANYDQYGQFLNPYPKN